MLFCTLRPETTAHRVAPGVDSTFATETVSSGMTAAR